MEGGYSFRFADDYDDDGVKGTRRSSTDESDPSSGDLGAKNGEICFSWHDTLSSVTTHDAVTGRPIPTFVICQELVDALPIHRFQKVRGRRLEGEVGRRSPSATTRRRRRPPTGFVRPWSVDTRARKSAGPLLPRRRRPSRSRRTTRRSHPPEGNAKKIPKIEVRPTPGYRARPP